ncbi:MAG: hypothetical protein JW994_05720, partial [Candidatus Omnitrophica bacterium]|nr:hypothetical protein [Candidatus Omnitrophota bacterium]
MNIKDLETYAKRNFDSAICLIGVIPFTIFIYLLVVQLGSIDILVGYTGYIMLVSMSLIILGIAMARKMLWVLINRIFEFNKNVVDLQNELV